MLVMTKEDLIDLIKDAGYCVLATSDGDQPRVRPMMPYLADDGKMYIACVPNARTIKQIKNNPKVEMCYIDRKMCFARIIGLANLSTVKTKKEVVWENIPMLRQYFTGPEDKNFFLIEVTILGVEVMTPQQQDPEAIIFN
jgi:uncharacterized pyridoxamine 5'-phosphate oxidase family protein